MMTPADVMKILLVERGCHLLREIEEFNTTAVSAGLNVSSDLSVARKHVYAVLEKCRLTQRQAA